MTLKSIMNSEENLTYQETLNIIRKSKNLGLTRSFKIILEYFIYMHVNTIDKEEQKGIDVIENLDMYYTNELLQYKINTNKEVSFFCSNEWIYENTNISTNTIQLAIRQLKKIGLIEISYFGGWRGNRKIKMSMIKLIELVKTEE